MKNKIVYLSIVLLLCANLLTSSCTDGCLACELDSKGDPVCKICDVNNFYRLTSLGKCQKWNVNNCEIPSVNPLKIACNLCMPGFSLDNRGNRCSPVPEKYLVLNCKRYGWEYSCRECNENFYLSRKKCKSISNPIEN